MFIGIGKSGRKEQLFRSKYFVLDKKKNIYKATIKGFDIKSEFVDENIDLYAMRIARYYLPYLTNIADFLLSCPEFDQEDGIYKGVSKELLMKSLNEPTFTILSEDSCLIEYLYQDLDQRVISFEVGGVYSDFGDLSITD